MAGNGSEHPEIETRQDADAGRDSYTAARDIYMGDTISINQASPPPAARPVRVWGNVPARNAAFTGREAQLSAVRESLLSGNPVAVQALHGMGGVGKTQLAVEYAHRFGGEYDVVWWLDSENAVLFAQQYADLALALGCAERGAPQDVVRRAVLSDLHERPLWLIVFDNAEDPGSLRDWMPSGPGHVLITSRSAGWAELAVPVPVDVLARAESVELLRNRVPGLAEPGAATLAEALGDLPLAIAQAAAYLAETRLPVAEYLALLKDRAFDLLCEGKPVTYRDSLSSVTTLAYDQLRCTDEDAARLAAICAFLAPEPVPAQWLAAAAAGFPDGLGARLADPLASRRLLTALTRTTLARLDDGGLTMHRLTQAILRTRLQPSGAIRVLATTVVTASSPDTVEPDTWPAWARLLPHLLALGPGQSDSRRLREVAAGAAWYLAISHPRDGVDLATGLHEQWRERLGPDDEQTVRVARALAEALRWLGHFDQAHRLDEDAVARLHRLHGDDHPGTLDAASALAADLYSLGDYQAARELDEDTLARRRRMLGESHPDTLSSACNLAVSLNALGEHQAARALHEDALAQYRRSLGDDHPFTLHAAYNLAIDLRAAGEHQAARELDEETLARRRRVLGKDHPHTLRSASSLAIDLRALGDQDAARALDEDTFERRRRVLGEEYPHTALHWPSQYG
jgi:hypothetical protein